MIELTVKLSAQEYTHLIRLRALLAKVQNKDESDSLNQQDFEDYLSVYERTFYGVMLAAMTAAATRDGQRVQEVLNG